MSIKESYAKTGGLIILYILISSFNFTYQEKENKNEKSEILQFIDCTINYQNNFSTSKILDKIKLLNIQLKKLNENIEKVYIYNHLSEAYSRIRKNDSSLYYAKKSFELIVKEKKSALKEKAHIESLLSLNTAYYHLRNSRISILHLKKAEKIIALSENKNLLLPLRQKITQWYGINYANIGEFKKVINSYTDFKKFITDHNLKTIKENPHLLVLLSKSYYQLKQIDQALLYACMSWDLALEAKNDFHIGIAGNTLADILISLNEVNEVPIYLKKALTSSLRRNHKAMIATTYKNLSLLEDKNGNSQKKLEYAKLAYHYALQDIESNHELFHTGMLYAETLNELNRVEEAVLILNNVIPLIQLFEHDIFNEKTLQLESKILRAKIEANRKKNLFKQQTETQKNWLITVLSCLFLLTITLIISLFSGLKKRQRLNRILLKQKNELNEVNESKSRLFTNISHELRTPLTLISGPIEQIFKEYEGSLDDKIKLKLEMIRKNTASLKNLVNNILDISKLDAKKLILNEKTLNVFEVVKNSIDSFELLAKQKSITFINEINDLQEYYAFIDASKIEKILSNLLSNAIKYTPSLGSVHIIVSIYKSSLKVIITDTGIGISEQDLPYIFDRYFQSNDPNKSLESGTGIGLSLVKELVDLMSGEITIKSVLKKGTEITLTIPIKKNDIICNKNLNSAINQLPESNEYLVSFELPKNQRHTSTVLVVEDHLDMLSYIISILETNYKIVTAKNGAEAITLLKSIEVDLIISDIMMPVMDGFTFLESVKEDNEFDNIPFIMLTALSDVNKKLKALTIGVDDYLTKPFEETELLARVYNLIQRYNVRKTSKTEALTTTKIDRFENQQHASTPNKNITLAEKINSRADVELVKTIALVIETNLENTAFKLSDLSKEVHLGERHLRRKIKKITGLTPKQFQQEIVLKKALILLENKAYNSVKAIAMSVGIVNVTRFSNLFEKRFGKRPADYLK